jgi:hypothetical protein
MAGIQKHRDLTIAIEPFQRFSRGLAEVEQPDHILFKRLDSEGRVTLDQITADDVDALVRAALKAAEEQ